MTELTLAQIVQVARRWWWLLALGPIVGAALGLALAAQSESVYRADAKLLVDRAAVTGGVESSSGAYNNILAAERLTQTFGQLVTTRAVLSETLIRMGDQAGDLTVDDLESAIAVTVVEDTQIIQIEATDSDPNRAALILNTVSEVFAEQAAIVTPDLPSENSDALQQSIDDIVEDMAATQDEIATLEASGSGSSATVQAQIRELRTLLGEYQSRHAELVEIQQRVTITAAESGVIVRTVDPAVAPQSPADANPAFLLFLGLIGGLAVAGAIVFLLGYLDNTLKTPTDLQQVTGYTTLGTIPAFECPEEFAALENLGLQSAEAFRTLRTNIQFATVGKVVRSIAVTSARSDDGTTTVAAYLAMVFAQGGQSVILVDSNLRAPSLHQIAGVPNRLGLSDLLLGESFEQIDRYLQSTDLDDFRILPSGSLPPNPADLLGSQRMEDLVRFLELRADLVLFDCPSLGYADALIVTGIADGALLNAAANRTRSNDLAGAIAKLDQVGRPVFGTVLNRVAVSDRKDHDLPAHLTSNGRDPDHADQDRPPRRERAGRVPEFLSRS